ncbi:MAG: phosphatase PAP2 family protein [Firmicutes bacterium]|nr:phosphatase PAP2 family protein [Bacillota bacterium]
MQKFREATNEILTPFFEDLSMFAVAWLFVIPAFIYWCTDKKAGLYVLFSFYMSIAINAVVKLTACIYRPWIRDARVVPAGDAITTATGYSFPSGHTSTAVPIYGGLALTNGKKHKITAAVCVILALLTMFSRNYLGVHTPQDVLTGCLVGCLSLTAASKIFAYLEIHPEKENAFLIAGFVLGWLALLYISVKPYPMDYFGGELLVDPKKMMKDGFGDIGAFIAFCAARFTEKKYVDFKNTGLDAKGVVTGVIGILIVQLFRKYGGPWLDEVLGIHWGHFVSNFVVVFYIVAGFPAVIKMIYSKKVR